MEVEDGRNSRFTEKVERRTEREEDGCQENCFISFSS